MAWYEVRCVDRMNLLLHSERMKSTQSVLEVPLLFDQFGIEIHAAKVLHIGITTRHAFSVGKLVA